MICNGLTRQRSICSRMLTRPDVQHLMLVGAYRDNEVSSTYPLMRKLEAIRQAGAKVQEILLAPLTSEDLTRLIADSIHSEPEGASACDSSISGGQGSSRHGYRCGSENLPGALTKIANFETPHYADFAD